MPACATLSVAAALFAFFRFAPLGKAIRACADNYTGALVVGLDVKRLYALTFGLGAACVGAAGRMLVLLIDVTPALGPALTLLAFIIVITGGLGSMPGALLGGVLIGLTEAFAGLLFTPSAKSMFSFGLLVLVLLFRPQGILGKRRHVAARCSMEFRAAASCCWRSCSPPCARRRGWPTTICSPCSSPFSISPIPARPGT